MTDILLIQPPIRDFYLTSKRTIPYGLACIAASLLRAGFSVEILDALATQKSRVIQPPPEMAYLTEYYGKPDVSPFALFHGFKHFGYGFQRIGRAAAESGAFLVGISSLFTPYSEEAISVAEAVKEHHPRCKIVMGGHHPTEMPEAVMQCKAVDYVIRGEGEVSMPLLAAALKEGRRRDDIPGLVLREKDGGVMVRAPVLMGSLDEYPPAAVDLLKVDFYRRGPKRSSAIVGSRGCPMTCTYCSMSASSHIRYRRRSVDRVLEEIVDLVLHHGVGFIDFEDENISQDRSWFLELLAGIKERLGGHHVELRAMNGLFVPTLDGEVVRAMKEAGFRSLNLSLGTICSEQLKRFRRPNVKEALDEVLHHGQSLGLKAVAYIIVGAPGQQASASVADLLYLAERPVLAGVSVYYPSPGSVDYGRCEAAGLLPAKFSLMRSSAVPVFDTTTRKESVTLLRLGRILNFMKLLKAEGEEIPAPGPFCHGRMTSSMERREVGITLLRWLLHDGIIRGLTPQGEVIEHSASLALTQSFISGIEKIRIQAG